MGQILPKSFARVFQYAERQQDEYLSDEENSGPCTSLEEEASPSSSSSTRMSQDSCEDGNEMSINESLDVKEMKTLEIYSCGACLQYKKIGGIRETAVSIQFLDSTIYNSAVFKVNMLSQTRARASLAAVDETIKYLGNNAHHYQKIVIYSPLSTVVSDFLIQSRNHSMTETDGYVKFENIDLLMNIARSVEGIDHNNICFKEADYLNNLIMAESYRQAKIVANDNLKCRVKNLKVSKKVTSRTALKNSIIIIPKRNRGTLTSAVNIGVKS